MKLSLAILLIFSFQSSSFGQLGKEYQNRRLRSALQVLDLKKGALFVRIRTKNKEVEYLRKYGREKEALKIETERAKLNSNIIRAFTSNFDFCPVYFFYSEDSKNIRLRQFDKVQFIDSTLKHNPSIQPTADCFFTAELGTVQADTAKFFTGYVVHETENGLAEKPTYVKGPVAGFKAIAVMSDQFIQLVHPFPYYVRSYMANPNQKRLFWYVEKLNIAINDYYDKVKTKSSTSLK
ncbi:MAG: hypothetical protein ACI857_002542 [Arenicella sp.]|jgi:hypothetical protein